MEAVIFWYLFVIIFAIQALFFLYFLIGLLIISKKKNAESEEGISIVVASKNEAENLKLLVPALLEQDYRKKEIIIVNDQSTDGTFDLLLDMEQQYSELKAVNIDHTPEHISRKKYAITLGIKAAKFDQILLTDADCIPSSKNWVSNFAIGFENNSKEILVGFSPYKASKGLLNLFIRFETLLTGLQYMGKAGYGRSYMGVGRNLAYRKSLFLKNNGFGKHANLISGDDDLFVNKHSTRKNTSALLNPENITVSEPKTTFKEYIDQKKRHYSVGKYYKFSDKFFLSIFTLTRLSVWIFLIIAFYLTNNYYILSSVIAGWALIYSISLGILVKKSGTRFPVILTAIFDLFFSLFYVVVALMSATSKKVKWK